MHGARRYISLSAFGVATGLSLLLMSCASISKSECQSGNWADIGYRDGTRGVSRDKLADYVQTCAKYGADVDRSAYLSAYENGLGHYCTYEQGLARGRLGKIYNTVCEGPKAADFRTGYENGLVQYCNYDNGFERGVRGEGYNKVCSGGFAVDYRAGYDDGRAEYEIRREYERYVERIDRKKNALEDVSHRLASSTLDEKERERLRYKKKRLLKELRDLQWRFRAFKRKYHLDWGL